MSVLNIWVLVLLAATQGRPIVGAEQPQPAIEGTVRRKYSQEPIAGVQVTAVMLESRTSDPTASPVTIASDENGHFSFSGIAVGDYRLLFARNGFVKQAYGQKSTAELGAVVHVGAKAVVGIEMELTATSAVSGRVFNSNREPLKGLAVSLLRYHYAATGQATEEIIARTMTDEEGNYRLSLLSPGSYYLSVIEEVSRVTPRPASEERTAFTTQYYPGVATITEALVLELKPGQEMAQVNLAIKRTALFAVQGRVVDDKGTDLKDNIIVSVFALNHGSYSSFGSAYDYRGAYDRTSGKISLRLPTGTYLVLASMSGIGMTPRGWSRVSVVDKDVDVILRVAAAFKLSGRVVFSEAAGRQAVEGAQIELNPVVNGSLTSITNFQASRTKVKNDGSFTLDTVFSFDYRVKVTGLPPGCYLTKIGFDGEDGLEMPLRISGPGAIEIVVGYAAGSITGTVDDGSLHPVPSSHVVLVPFERLQRTDLYRYTSADSNGSFSFLNVPAGNYRLVAWEAIEMYSWFGPELISRVEQASRSVTVTDTAQRIDIRAIQSAR